VGWWWVCLSEEVRAEERKELRGEWGFFVYTGALLSGLVGEKTWEVLFGCAPWHNSLYRSREWKHIRQDREEDHLLVKEKHIFVSIL
jgi:hypothetical protein